ncbi:MAG: hypothetical protein HY314_07525 [Acidobacteria bacterium]|nr:hypothetical protein [Acidobacteriota bacterium]
MNKSIRLLMNLVLFLSSALLSAPAAWAHDCGERTVVLNPGGTKTITINGITDTGADCPTTYMAAEVEAEDLKKILTVTVEQRDANDAKVTFQASRDFFGPPVTGMVMVPWTTACPEGQGACTYTVTVMEETRTTNEFSLVPSVCSSDGSPRAIYVNNSSKEFRVTIDAATTCQQEFVDADRPRDVTRRETVVNGERSFEFPVLPGKLIQMKCTGSGTCSYRIRGFVTAGDITESCDFGPELIYENMTGKEVTVTIEGTTNCPTQSFDVVAGNTVNQSFSVGSGERTQLFSFNVPPGQSVFMLCTGQTGAGKCRYIFAGPTTGTRQSDQVSCNRKKQIYRNGSGREVEVTVQVTASCNGATLTLDGRAGGNPIPAGRTTARTFTVPDGGIIELECCLSVLDPEAEGTAPTRPSKENSTWGSGAVVRFSHFSHPGPRPRANGGNAHMKIIRQ